MLLRMWLLAAGVMALGVCGCQSTRPESPRLELAQTLATFDRPESCSVSLNGRHLFVSNCASGEYGPNGNFALARGRGAISKLAIAEDGTLTMLEPRFVAGITAPLGQSPLPVATGRFPRGALFVNTGFFMQTDEAGEYITNSTELQTGVTIFDADTGERLGFVPLGLGSKVAARAGTEFLVPNGLAFDAEGNLYVGETGGENRITEPSMDAKGGVLRIDHAAIDALAAGADHEGVHFVERPGTNGVLFDQGQQAILAVTCTGDKTVDGIYRIPVAGFGSGPVEPIIVGLEPLDSIVPLASGRYVCSAMTGTLWAADLKERRAWPLALPGGISLEGPSDMKLLRTVEGQSLLLVPEQDFKNPERWVQRLRVFRVEE
jgi:hypothetical protein